MKHSRSAIGCASWWKYPCTPPTFKQYPSLIHHLSIIYHQIITIHKYTHGSIRWYLHKPSEAQGPPRALHRKASAKISNIVSRRARVRASGKRCLANMDSYLDTHSLNPTDGSFVVVPNHISERSVPLVLTSITVSASNSSVQYHSPVTRRSKPSSHSLLASEQSEPLGPRRLNDRKSQHRRINKQRCYGSPAVAPGPSFPRGRRQGGSP